MSNAKICTDLDMLIVADFEKGTAGGTTLCNIHTEQMEPSEYPELTETVLLIVADFEKGTAGETTLHSISN